MKTLTAFGGACAALCLLAGAPVMAQDASPWWAAKSDGDWLVRIRAVGVIPDEDLSLDQVAGADIDISDTLIPELDITYFFTPNIAAELILGTTPHDLRGRGSIDGANLGDVWLLPPTLTLQYHVTQLGDWTGVEGLGKLKPYVGAGVNYTIFYGGDDGQFDKVALDDTFGWALQAGFDYEISEGIYLNADVKKVFLETDVSVNSGALTGTATIDPWLVGVGVGYRF
jgi:outer membrane protein